MDTADLVVAVLMAEWTEKEIQERRMMLKLVTFNIRCDYDQDGVNSFRFRKPVILKKLAEEKPDVICFQEVLPHVAAWLKENLTEYTVIGCGRSETLEDEQMTVAFRTNRLNLINMETFWLSPTPYVPGVYGSGAGGSSGKEGFPSV